MARPNAVFVCGSCGGETLKWQGQCPLCGEWNSLEQRNPARTRPAAPAAAVSLGRPPAEDARRFGSGQAELDRVLGGGIIPGSVILLGGDPGIGKSTLLLQVAARVAASRPVIYASGEESVAQIGLRAQRLALTAGALGVVADTDLASILALAAEQRAAVLVIDSIQTVQSGSAGAGAGAVSQLRECTAQLVRYAKSSGTAIIIVGHLTKEGTIAGPRLLEHLVDTVLYFESEAGSRYRIVRATKNRFGAVNELGFFAMSASGLKEVRNPAAIFLSRSPPASRAARCRPSSWRSARSGSPARCARSRTGMNGCAKRARRDFASRSCRATTRRAKPPPGSRCSRSRAWPRRWRRRLRRARNRHGGFSARRRAHPHGADDVVAD